MRCQRRQEAKGGAAISSRPASISGVASTTAAVTICTIEKEVDDFYASGREEERTCNGDPTVGASKESAQ
jgi:hypothetical protein